MSSNSESLSFEKVCGHKGIADVVFVHGLNGSPTETWTGNPCVEPEGGFWPKWIEKDVPGISIYTVGYPASLFAKWAKKELNLYERAKTVLEYFAAEGLGTRPLVLIGHSLGGLLSKQILRVAAESTDTAWTGIASHCRQVFFIATPHSGSSIASILSKIAGGFSSSHVELLEKDSTELDQLNESFRVLAARTGLAVHIYYEAWATGNLAIVVDKRSADPGLSGVQAIGIDSDHIEIARPKSRNSLLYVSIRRHLAAFVSEIVPELSRESTADFASDALGTYGGDRRDLLSKLIAAGREHEYPLANDKQNKFARAYYRTGLVKPARDAHDQLLADVDQRFTSHIYHELICKGATSEKITLAIQEFIIEPLQTKYAAGGATADTILNALYFLTERCHIRWDAP